LSYIVAVFKKDNPNVIYATVVDNVEDFKVPEDYELYNIQENLDQDKLDEWL